MGRKCSKCGFEPPPMEGYRLTACPECQTPYISWAASGEKSGEVEGQRLDGDTGYQKPEIRPEGAGISVEPVYGFWARQSSNIDAWGADHAWPWRAALWVFCIYTGVRYAIKWDFHGLFGGINFGIHELGHVVIQFNQFLHFAAGTVFQLTAPVIGFFMFYRQKEYFGLSVAGVWMATNLYYVAWYMSSADRPNSIDLIAPWANPKHDWTWLFQKMGLIKHCHGIAAFTRWSAHILIWSSIIFGAWVLWKMVKAKQPS